MTMSNYLHGFENRVSIKNFPIDIAIPEDAHVFWVNSVMGSNSNRGTARYPFSTIDYAVGQCTADKGDVVLVAAGHTETVIAAAGLTCDVAGVTIHFLGEGSNKATINLGTAVTASVVVSAANVSLIDPRFVAAIDALTGPISVTGINCYIQNAEYNDGTSIDTTDALVAIATATGIHINGWCYIAGDEGGTQKQSHIQLNGVDNAILNNIDIVGDFATGNVENVTDEILNARINNWKIKNTNSGPIPGLVLDANATGQAKNIDIRIASGTTYVSSVAKLNWDGSCLGYNTDGEGGDPIGTADASSIEGKIDLLQTNVGDLTGLTLVDIASQFGDMPASLATQFGDFTGFSLVSLAAKFGEDTSTIAANFALLKAGSVLVVQKTLVSSAIVQAGVDITGVSSGGDLIIEDIAFNTDGTGLAAGTNFTVESDNANGVAVFFAETVANLGANKTENIASGSVTAIAGVVLETGKKLIAKATVADCTGVGTITLTMKLRRVAAGATIAAA